VLIQPHQLLCDAARCRTGTGDHSLYVDDNHLSITGAALLRPLFEPVFAMKAASIEHVEVRFNVIGPRMERASCEC
jgi:hypothetical protein